MQHLLEQVVARNNRDTVLSVSRPHRRCLSDVQVPAVHVERLTELGERTNVIISLLHIVEVKSAQVQNTFVLDGRQPFVFVCELVRAAEIELARLDEVSSQKITHLNST